MAAAPLVLLKVPVPLGRFVCLLEELGASLHRDHLPSPHLMPPFFHFSPSAVGMFVYLTLLFIFVFFDCKADYHC